MTKFAVTIRCVVKKVVTCEDCTEDQAWEDPFEFAVDEMEVDQIDWEVLDVKEDK
jgi:hypothetical protein